MAVPKVRCEWVGSVRVSVYMCTLTGQLLSLVPSFTRYFHLTTFTHLPCRHSGAASSSVCHCLPQPHSLQLLGLRFTPGVREGVSHAGEALTEHCPTEGHFEPSRDCSLQLGFPLFYSIIHVNPKSPLHLVIK